MLRVSPRPASGRLRSSYSPLPLLAGGILVALLAIVLVTLPPKQAGPDGSKAAGLNDQEAIALVARDMRSAAAALRVSTEGRAHFEDGSWTVEVGNAQFRFSERNRISLPLNDAARALSYRDP